MLMSLSTDGHANRMVSQRPHGFVRSRALLVAGAVLVSAVATAGIADAKTPGSTYCFYKKCHRVNSLSETRALVGKNITLTASHYNDCRRDRYNPCGLTSSGEKFRPDRADNAASPIYPDGTVLVVWHEATRDAAVVRVNNAGPYWGNRKLDVSIAAAEQLGFRGKGVTTLVTRIIKAPDKLESRYVRDRRYWPVPGYIGKYASIEEAERAAVAAMAVTAIAASMIAPTSGAVAMATQAETKSESKGRLAKALLAESLQAATHQIEKMPARTLATAPLPRTLTDAWTATKKFRQASAETAATANPTPRAVTVSRRLPIAEQARPSPMAVPLITAKEVGAGRDIDWQALLNGRQALLSGKEVSPLNRIAFSHEIGKTSVMAQRDAAYTKLKTEHDVHDNACHRAVVTEMPFDDPLRGRTYPVGA